MKSSFDVTLFSTVLGGAGVETGCLTPRYPRPVSIVNYHDIKSGFHDQKHLTGSITYFQHILVQSPCGIRQVATVSTQCLNAFLSINHIMPYTQNLHWDITCHLPTNEWTIPSANAAKHIGKGLPIQHHTTPNVI